MAVKSIAYAPRVTWDNLPGRPTTFPPSAHTHAWGEVTGKPSTYPPASHTHPWGEITGAPASYPPSAHTHGWTDITGKPATYPPSAHTHFWTDITDRPTIPAATPLATTAARALGTAAVGTSTNAAREDHVHPLPAGRMEFIGNFSVAEQTLLALGLGMKRMTLTVQGVTMADMGKLMVVPNGVPTAGCELQNAYPVAANSVSIGYFTPALGLAASYALPGALFRIVT